MGGDLPTSSASVAPTSVGMLMNSFCTFWFPSCTIQAEFCADICKAKSLQIISCAGGCLLVRQARNEEHFSWKRPFVNQISFEAVEPTASQVNLFCKEKPLLRLSDYSFQRDKAYLSGLLLDIVSSYWQAFLSGLHKQSVVRNFGSSWFSSTWGRVWASSLLLHDTKMS